VPESKHLETLQLIDVFTHVHEELAQRTRDVPATNRPRSVTAVSGLQPIAACPHACVIAKNSALLPLYSNHGRQDACVCGAFPDGDYQGSGWEFL